jgi:uncharacterized protein (TIGR00369 family)
MTNQTTETLSTSETSQTKIKQPNSRHCFVCGIENKFGLQLKFYETNSGDVVVETTVPERFQGYPGVVHGGIVAALVDEVLGRVHFGSDPENPRFMYTAKLAVNYRKPVPTNKLIQVVGHGVKSKKRAATSTAEIYGPEGDLLAEAEAILVNVPEGIINSDTLDELGWKIYPD